MAYSRSGNQSIPKVRTLPRGKGEVPVKVCNGIHSWTNVGGRFSKGEGDKKLHYQPQKCIGCGKSRNLCIIKTGR